ncbi:MAG: DUF2782 domain-containing protein [Tahibacter sp.]
MNRAAYLLMFTMIAFAAQAADPPKPASGLASAPPPPAMDAPGVTTAPEVPVESSVPTAPSTAIAPNGKPAPEVSVKKSGDDTIEEYRQGGKLTMIRITRKGGVPQTYIDTDGDGKLEGNPKEGPVAPVYYTLYNWN